MAGPAKRIARLSGPTTSTDRPGEKLLPPIVNVCADALRAGADGDTDEITGPASLAWRLVSATIGGATSEVATASTAAMCACMVSSCGTPMLAAVVSASCPRLHSVPRLEHLQSRSAYQPRDDS